MSWKIQKEKGVQVTDDQQTQTSRTRKNNSYFYADVKKRVIEIEKAFRLVGESKAKERSFQHDRYAKGGKKSGDIKPGILCQKKGDGNSKA